MSFLVLEGGSGSCGGLGPMGAIPTIALACSGGASPGCGPDATAILSIIDVGLAAQAVGTEARALADGTASAGRGIGGSSNWETTWAYFTASAGTSTCGGACTAGPSSCGPAPYSPASSKCLRVGTCGAGYS